MHNAKWRQIRHMSLFHQLGFEVYPSPALSNCVIDVYNALLSTHWLLDHTELSLVLDNEAIYNLCRKKMKIEQPDHHAMNRLTRKVISSMTSMLRFPGYYNDIFDYAYNCYRGWPRLHFQTLSIAPITSKKGKFDAIYKSIDESPLIKQLQVPPIVNEAIANYAYLEVLDARQVSEDCCNSENFFVDYPDFDAEEDEYRPGTGRRHGADYRDRRNWSIGVLGISYDTYLV